MWAPTELIDDTCTSDATVSFGTLLCICASFPPDITPTSIRTSKILHRLQDRWKIHVLTEVSATPRDDGIIVHPVRNPYPTCVAHWLKKVKGDKLIDWIAWPDSTLYWIVPALYRAWRLSKRYRFDAIVVFMMPYSAGIVGLILKRLTRLPLLLNLDDSPTCTDMQPHFPSYLHYRINRTLENAYATAADAIIYVSQLNLDNVRARLPRHLHDKLHLVRYGADPDDFTPALTDRDATRPFRVVYIGGMNGWYYFEDESGAVPWTKRLYRTWMRFGRHNLVELDNRGSSPIFIGRAMRAVFAAHPAWANALKVEVYGNKFPFDVITRTLTIQGLTDIVAVNGPISNAAAVQRAREADMLFLALPDRPDGSAGGRISAKTYEYLMTDRPILAAVPPGENRTYLEDKPGVWIVDPCDASAMERAIMEVATAHFAGHPLRFDRGALRDELSYARRADEFAHILQTLCIARVRTVRRGQQWRSAS